MPGGIGTFEEFFEILTLKQLCRHNKPIAIYNIRDYYDSMNSFMEECISKGFIRENCRELYFTTASPEALCDYIEAPVKQHTVHELKDG